MDQWNNKVDQEIWISPKPEWKPLGPNDWLNQPAIGIDVAPLGTDVKYEYAIAYADGNVGKGTYLSEGTARRDLMEIRNVLAGYAIPEDYHPILMKREIITTIGSWKHLSV